jgi:cell division septation protein DedD
VVPPEPVRPPFQALTPAELAALDAAAARYVPRRPLVSTSTSAPQVTASAPSKKSPTVPGFYINVGLFAVDKNAQNAHAKLLGAGLPALSQTLNTSKGKLTRLRVGPLETRQQAQAAVKQIRALKLDAVMLQP